MASEESGSNQVQVPIGDMAARAEATRTYRDAINALNTLQSNFASIEAIRKLGPNANKNELSIKEVYEFTRRMGYDPKDFNKLNIIHVTGTKGKGSTCAFTESILKQYSSPPYPIKKIGLYTSPHLKTVRERIRINGEPISEPLFTRYFFEVWDRLSLTKSSETEFPTLQPSDKVKPMYFKYLTVLSFHIFMSEGVDTAIYEVGVGGKYDSTNIIDKPTVTGISALGIDHTFMLGDTIESITSNKVGIFKRNCPAVVAKQLDYPDMEPFIAKRASEIGVSSLQFVGPNILPKDISLGLAGDFQRQNAALAVVLATVHLRKLGVPSSELPGLDGSLPDRFKIGLAQTHWPGRCQVIRNKPNFENITWFVDGAHTLESIKASSGWFKQTQSNRIRSNSDIKVLLFNQQGRENAPKLLECLYESAVLDHFKFDHAIFTTNVTWSDGNFNSDLLSLNHSKESVDKLIVQKELAATWGKLDEMHHEKTRKHIFPDIETSLNFIKGLAGSDSNVEVFVCGSLHLVGGFLVVLDNEKN